MNTPLILTNFKHYPSAVAHNALTLTDTHIKAKNSTGKNFAVAVSNLDLQTVCAEYATKIDIFAQHCDNATFGSSTGKILPQMIKKMGAAGVILNHSENRFADFAVLQETIASAKKAELTVVVCAESAEEGEKIATQTSADFIAVEPPELIGGDISICTADPELITQSVAKIGDNKVLVGAGVKNGKDVQVAVQKGSMGVLLASGVTKADDPLAVLQDLVSRI